MTRDARRRRVAVLGAGITGCCIALFLARKGIPVSLFDMRRAPMEGASRWNEGKIHLGYLYGADSSLATARHVLPGGLAFRPLMQELLEQDLSGQVTGNDDVFLIHRDSVVGADQARAYYLSVDELLKHSDDASDYLCDLRGRSTQQLSSAELAAIADPAWVSAGFRVPERSVHTHWFADQLCAAVAAQAGIEQRMDERVDTVRRHDGTTGRWQVVTAENSETFDCVVNALWHGRLAIDSAAGLAPPAEWSARYRLALFVRTGKPLDTPSAVLGVGPFGDIKNYNGRDFYLSWYPAGLVHESDAPSPVGEETLALALDHDAVEKATGENLSAILSGVGEILASSVETRVGGGWVVAQGRGPLSSPGSTLHRRDRFGVSRLGTYYSVDTGKYSTAPWLAHALAGEIAAG